MLKSSAAVGLASRMVAKFSRLGGIVVSDNGVIYVSNTGNHCVRMIESGIVTCIAGVAGKAGFKDNVAADEALLNAPLGLSLVHDGLLIADSGNHCIRKLRFRDGLLVTVAGDPNCRGFRDGPALFNMPFGISGPDRYNAESFYISDCKNHCIRKLDQTAGVVTTVAGCGGEGFQDGMPHLSMLNHPCGISLMPSDGSLLIADSHNDAIRHWKEGILTTVVAPHPELLSLPTDVYAVPEEDGLFYVADYRNCRILSFVMYSQGDLALTA